ncbi:MAG: type II toxin-antitoxin system VapC family toxin [Candidatus Kariarchaeaceae archaeon]|jgi:PIN domain nuclease of toxin-antitoxin system
MRYVLDTHAFLWYLTDDNRLGSNAKQILEKIDQDEGKVFIPSIILAESIFVLEKKRVSGITFPDIMEKIRNSSNYIIINLDWQILDRIAKNTEIPELHDRIIVETAKLYDADIVTKDKHVRQTVTNTIW